MTERGVSQFPVKHLSHAKERAAERMGVGLSGDDFKGMVRKIRAGEGVRFRDCPDGKEHWLVTWAGKAFRVIFARDPGYIVTVLPRLGQHRARRERP